MAKARSKTKRRRPEPEDYVSEDEDYDEYEDDEEEFDEEEEEEDERPRRRSRSSSRRRSARDDDDDDDDDEEEEDERPRRRSSKKKSSKGKRGKKSRSSDKAADVRGGWGEFKRQKEAGGNFPDLWKPGDEEELVKFLDDEPFATYRLHWFDEIRKGKKGFVCVEDDCPACDLGDNPGLKARFNILVFDEDGGASLKVIDAGVRLGNQIEKLAKGKRTGPLSRHYWAIISAGDNSGTANFNLVKERDLEDDWGIEPLTDEELDDFLDKRFDKSSVDRKNRKELEDVVSALFDE